MSTRNRTRANQTRANQTRANQTTLEGAGTPNDVSGRRGRGHQGQLRLVTTERPDWRLDARTRRIGRRGVAEARAILARAHPPEPFAPESLAG